MSEKLDFLPEASESFQAPETSSETIESPIDPEHANKEAGDSQLNMNDLNRESIPAEVESNSLTSEYERIMSSNRENIKGYTAADGVVPLQLEDLTKNYIQTEELINKHGWDEVFTRTFANILVYARYGKGDAKEIDHVSRRLLDELIVSSSLLGIPRSESDRREAIYEHSKELLSTAIQNENSQNRHLLRPASPTTNEQLLRPAKGGMGNENEEELLRPSEKPEGNET